MFSIVVGVVVGILVFLCGYLAGWNNCHSKIKVGAPSTSTNSQSVPLVKCMDCDNKAVYHFCKDHFVITGK